VSGLGGADLAAGGRVKDAEGAAKRGVGEPILLGSGCARSACPLPNKIGGTTHPWGGPQRPDTLRPVHSRTQRNADPTSSCETGVVAGSPARAVGGRWVPERVDHGRGTRGGRAGSRAV